MRLEAKMFLYVLPCMQAAGGCQENFRNVVSELPVVARGTSPTDSWYLNSCPEINLLGKLTILSTAQIGSSKSFSNTEQA